MSDNKLSSPSIVIRLCDEGVKTFINANPGMAVCLIAAGVECVAKKAGIPADTLAKMITDAIAESEVGEDDVEEGEE